MTRREVPLQWLPVLEAAGIHSARDLARELEVSPQTAIRLLHGEATSRETVEAAATLLGVSPERVQELRNETPTPAFRLPPEADRLSQRQRAAIVAVVRAMLETRDDPPMTLDPDVVALEAELGELHEEVAPRSTNGPRGRRR